MSDGTSIVGSRRGRSVVSHLVANEHSVGLEPLAVDAAFADETMPLQEERGSRRDAPHGGSTAELSLEPVTADDQLLQSLSAQLELLNQQQYEIRRLLDQAGRRRVDRVAN